MGHSQKHWIDSLQFKLEKGKKWKKEKEKAEKDKPENVKLCGSRATLKNAKGNEMWKRRRLQLQKSRVQEVDEEEVSRGSSVLALLPYCFLFFFLLRE